MSDSTTTRPPASDSAMEPPAPTSPGASADPVTAPPENDVIEVLTEENRALEDALKLSRRRLAGMRDVATALAGRLDLDELLRSIIGKVSELLDCERTTLFVIDEERRELWSRVIEGTDTIRLPLGSGVAGYVGATGLPLNLGDAYADPRFDPRFDEKSGYRTRSLLAVPITSPEGKVVGVVEALNKRVGPFGIEDERLLEAVTGQISVALKNAFLFEQLKDKAARLERAQAELQRRVGELDLLASLEQAMATAATEGALLEVVVKRVRDILGADAASVALVEPKLTALRFHAATGVAEERIVGTTLPLDTGIVGSAVASEMAVRVEDASLDTRHAERFARDLGIYPGPLMAVPLVVPLVEHAGADKEQRPYGAITVLRDRSSERAQIPFTSDDERLLHLVAARVASALHDARRRERTKHAEQLERLGTMLASIVHDLKTPMTVISGYVQLMASEESGAERQQSAEIVLKNCEQMTSMIKELLSFTRGDSSILIRKVYVQHFVREVEDMLRRLLANRPGISIQTKVGYRGAVRLDDLKLKRAITNLAKNAFEAMGEGGVLTLAVEQIGDQVELAVSDTGPGLPPEIEGRLFEQFATHGKKEGTGLGLALVKKIVDDHHGEIRVESRRGEGCTFRLRVPL
jgi:signal transduction histidine kinase